MLMHLESLSLEYKANQEEAVQLALAGIVLNKFLVWKLNNWLTTYIYLRQVNFNQ